MCIFFSFSEVVRIRVVVWVLCQTSLKKKEAGWAQGLLQGRTQKARNQIRAEQGFELKLSKILQILYLALQHQNFWGFWYIDFPISPLLGELCVHFFDQIDMQFYPGIPCLLLPSLRHSVALLKRKSWSATMKSWILATASSDFYSFFFFFQSAHLYHSLLLDIFTSYLDSLKPLMKFCFVSFLSSFPF